MSALELEDGMRVQIAPGQRGCCDAAGRLMMMAVAPIRIDALVMRAQGLGEGTRAQIRERICDLLAGGLLIDVGEG